MNVRQSVTVTNEKHPRHGQAGTIEGFAKVGVGKNRTDGVQVRFHNPDDPDEGVLIALPLASVKLLPGQ